MSSPVNKITDLCRFLPKKDQFYADAFIIRRDFTSLRDLVSSAIKKVEKNNNKAVPNEELLSILPFIDDVDYAMDKLREEREELTESGYGSFELGGTDNVQQDNKQTSNFNE